MEVVVPSAVWKRLGVLLPPGVVEDPDERLRGGLLTVLLLGGAGSGVGVSITRIATEGMTAVGVGGLALSAFQLLLYGFYRATGRRGLVGDVGVGLTTLMLCALAGSDGGLASPSALWFAALPMIASFVGGRIRTMPSAALSIACLGILLLAERRGGMPQFAQAPVSSSSRFLILAGFIVYISAGVTLYDLGRRKMDEQRRRLDRLKDEWIATVSHELRTPLTGIYGAVRLLQSGAGGDLGPEATVLVNIATDDTVRLRKLVENLLDLRSIELDTLQLQRQAIELADVVEATVEGQSASAVEGRVHIVVNASRPMPAFADEARIAQVVENIVSNAVKFSPEGGTVHARLSRRGDVAHFEVEDEGPGIPDSFRPRIFTRFSQADGSASRVKGGTGLGLAISKAIVELHGGIIGFDCEEGRGATFWFDLPLDDRSLHGVRATHASMTSADEAP